MTGALQLLLGDVDGAVVSHRSGFNHQSGFGHSLEHSLAHLVGGHDLDEFTVCGRMQGRRAADENDFCAAALRGFGQRVTHFAAGAVAEETNGVKGLARAAGGDENNFSCQVMTAAERIEHRVGNGLRLGHAACADHAAGQIACAWFNNADAALTQRFKVGLRGWVVPHIHVHRGSHQDRRLCGQVHCGEEVVGDAVGEFGQDVGRGRSNDQRIGPLRLADVLNAILFACGFTAAIDGARVVPEAGDDLVAGQRGEGEGLDKPGGRRGHDHVDFKGLALQGAHQFRRLVGGNSAGDAHGYSHGSIVAGFDCGRRDAGWKKLTEIARE